MEFRVFYFKEKIREIKRESAADLYIESSYRSSLPTSSAAVFFFPKFFVVYLLSGAMR
jgi:DNA-dependent RNA polymerase auxiliary subunit epsilon